MKRVAFFQGTFDILNCGHVRAISLVASQVDTLVIGLNTDDVIRSGKNREPVIPFEQRKEILEGVKGVDLVIPCDGIYALPYLQQLGATVFVTIEEWKARQHEAITWVEEQGGEVIVPPYFPHDGITLSSTDIRAKVLERGSK